MQIIEAIARILVFITIVTILVLTMLIVRDLVTIWMMRDCRPMIDARLPQSIDEMRMPPDLFPILPQDVKG